VVPQGTQYFTDYVLKLRDRGDIPRKTAVEAAGFDWEAGVAQRKREAAAGIDEVMAPAATPFQDAGSPQDNNSGRPTGTSPNNGRPGAKQGPGRDNVRPLRTINKNAGETVKAVLDVGEDGEQLTRRVGERTYAILEQFPERTIGRVTGLERDTLAQGKPLRSGPLAIIPVNPGYDVGELRAVRLAAGLSMLVGERKTDAAIVAKGLCFREPEFDLGLPDHGVGGARGARRARAGEGGAQRLARWPDGRRERRRADEEDHQARRRRQHQRDRGGDRR
jgi:hypothetical protein